MNVTASFPGFVSSFVRKTSEAARKILNVKSRGRPYSKTIIENIFY